MAASLAGVALAEVLVPYLCSCSWLCLVLHRSAVLRRAWPRCCSARLRRMTGCSSSRDGLLSMVAHAVQIAAQSCCELYST